MKRARSKVVLVGAGPGDPGLLTLRGFEALCEADAILYDHLVNPAILRFAKTGAKKIFVGKKSGMPRYIKTPLFAKGGVFIWTL